VAEDPFAVPVAEKTAVLRRVEAAAKGTLSVVGFAGHLTASKTATAYADSEGASVEQMRVVTGWGGRVLAQATGRSAIRHFPQALGGWFGTGGYELISTGELEVQAELAGQQAAALLHAVDPVERPGTVILSGSVVALILHETFGHAAELDGVLGLQPPRAAVAGWVDVGIRRVASDSVTVTADSGFEHGLGTYEFDDEGVPSGRTTLVDGGVWMGFLGDRETHAILELPSGIGCARAADFNSPPLVRMPNVNLEPGQSTLSDLIADTSRGVLLDTPLWIEVGAGARRFRVGCEMGWEIVDGEVTRPIRAPAISAISEDFWLSCDAVCGSEDWGLYSMPDCRKGLPAQLIGTSHGAAPARFHGVRIEARPR